MSEEQLWSILDDVKSVHIHYTTKDLLKDFREEALRHREEISQLKDQLQQKENKEKEIREYIEQLLEYKKDKKVSLEYIERIIDIINQDKRY